jgi:hypothetical protein
MPHLNVPIDASLECPHGAALHATANLILSWCLPVTLTAVGGFLPLHAGGPNKGAARKSSGDLTLKKTRQGVNKLREKPFIDKKTISFIDS